MVLICHQDALPETALPESKSQTCWVGEQSRDLHPCTGSTPMIHPSPVYMCNTLQLCVNENQGPHPTPYLSTLSDKDKVIESLVLPTCQ